MKLNKYGLKITGLKKLAGELQATLPKHNDWYSGKYFQINLNTETGEVWGDFFYSLGKNSWSEYHDENIIVIGRTYKPLTMQGIIDKIAYELKDWQYQERHGSGITYFYGKATKEFLGVPYYD